MESRPDVLSVYESKLPLQADRQTSTEQTGEGSNPCKDNQQTPVAKDVLENPPAKGVVGKQALLQLLRPFQRLAACTLGLSAHTYAHTHAHTNTHAQNRERGSDTHSQSPTNKQRRLAPVPFRSHLPFSFLAKFRTPQYQ
mmetsp:Transcript_27461/g.68899  ORF Transcript_27461/g.68899 Transcript_27461/m.68899 type:complete len:140 (-) Transcript_27461:37-456(-)